MAKQKKSDDIEKDTEVIEETETAQEPQEQEPAEEPVDSETPLDKAIRERDEYLAALQRERADFDNFKKRNAIATSKAYNDGRTDAVTAMLPVIDNLERAVASVDAEDDPMKKGVEMVLRQMADVLGSLGIEEIEAQGKKFDPNFHNAVMQEDGEEDEESDTVKEVLMKGYKSGDKVLRHSMVKVVK